MEKELLKKLFVVEVFLENSFEEMAVRIPPAGASEVNFAKFKGGKEFALGSGSVITINAINEEKEMTAMQYENY